MNTLKNFKYNWIISNSFSYLLGFISFILIGIITSSIAPESVAQIDRAKMIGHLDPNNLPDWLDRSTYEAMYLFTIRQHLVMYSIFGLLLGGLQSLVLKKYLLKVWPWVLVSVIGFLIIISGELIQRHLIIGPHAGPVEPIFIVLGGGGMAGIFQYIWLRTQNIVANQWLVLWISGLILGIAVAVGILTGIGALFGDSISTLEKTAPKVAFGIELGLFGAISGAVAARISAKPLYQKLNEKN